MATKYGKTIKIENRKYRYNFDTNNVEYFYKNEDGEIEVITSVGLTLDGYKRDGKEYISQWDDELQEEFSYMIAEFL